MITVNFNRDESEMKTKIIKREQKKVIFRKRRIHCGCKKEERSLKHEVIEIANIF